MNIFKKHEWHFIYVAFALFLVFAVGSLCNADISANRADMGKSVVIMCPDTEPVTFGASDTTQTFTLNYNGFVNAYAVVMPNFTNAPTGNLKITNSGSLDVYDSSGSDRDESDFANNATTHVYGLKDVITLAGVNTVTITLSGVPGGSGGIVYVTFWLE